ncbi:Carotene epsilon-monooxygenase, chloroplastic [Zea mays]|uniref:Carotene epsilon-monooxygenase, chloroplastic n=1 Tax=Zea mays TaxID=4577 RepID=A0A317YAM0_MAIZE|nr:Carotene epsilon-monooxygenase, chloroplastic [Zea mays]
MPATVFASPSIAASPLPSPSSPRPPPRRVHVRVRVRPPPPRSGSSGGDEPSNATPWASPDWLTSLSRAVGRSGGDDSGIPVASAKLDDVRDLLGGALFLPLFKWFREEGPVYRLAAGPQDFVIVSDPAVARHVLRGYGSRYAKGLVAEVSEFLFGSGFAIAEGDLWTVSSVQLRDDLLSMLVAGHETTGSVLTWTIYLLSKDPTALRRAQDEVDRVLQGRLPKYEDVKELKYLMRCINESMRLYPHPPVLLRRAIVDDVLPGNYKVKAGQDIMISVYNIHRSPEVWDRADEFIPERFDLEGPVPNESNTDFRFIPFSGGPRKCVGDQFALLEAIVALAVVLQKMDMQLVPDQKINMTTGATIHTTSGLYMNVSLRKVQQEAELALSESK